MLAAQRVGGGPHIFRLHVTVVESPFVAFGYESLQWSHDFVYFFCLRMGGFSGGGFILALSSGSSRDCISADKSSGPVHPRRRVLLDFSASAPQAVELGGVRGGLLPPPHGD